MLINYITIRNHDSKFNAILPCKNKTRFIFVILHFSSDYHFIERCQHDRILILRLYIKKLFQILCDCKGLFSYLHFTSYRQRCTWQRK